MVPALCLVLLLAGAYATGRWAQAGAPVLIVASLAWLVVNRTMEGGVLVSFTPDHGLVAADLVGLAGLVLGAVVLFSGTGKP
jgi:hypothetical protein